MPALLTAASTMMCPHGGTVMPIPGSTRVIADAPVLRMSDTCTIAGCPFLIVLVPSPCVTVQWVQPAARSKAVDDFTLTEQSVGLCQAADQAVQGTVLVLATQTQAGGL